MKKRMMIYLAAAVVAALLPQLALAAQISSAGGTLHGVVTDPSGAAIPGASVTVASGHFVRTVSTGATGQYAVAGLPPGHYRVEVHAAGFSPFGRSGLVVSAGYETEANAPLVIGAVKQAITVTAAPAD